MTELVDGDMAASYNLLVSFPDQSPSFVHGFEAGQIWEQVRTAGQGALSITAHTENLQVIERMALAQGWTFEARATAIPGWHQVELKFDKSPKRNNPHGLRVVE